MSNLRRKWRDRLVLGLALFAVVGGAAAAWRFFDGQERPEPPGIEQQGADPDVFAAVERARQQVAVDPHSAKAWGELGMVLLIHEYEAKAEQCLVEAQKLEPKNARWVFYRARNAMREFPERAVALLNEAMDLEHPGPSHRRAARLLLADLLLERGEVDASESILLDESANNRDDPRICYQLGAIAMSRNELEKAERFLRTAMTSPSSRKKAGALLAVLARRQGDEAKSQLLEKAAADFPGDLPWPNPYFDDLSNFAAGSEARSRQAEMFEAQGRLDEALRIYLGLTRTHPTQRNFVRAALIFAKLNDSVNTEAYLKSSLEFDPKQAHIHYFLAQMFYLRAERLWSNESERVQARQLLEESLKYAAQATELKAHFGQCDVVAGRAYLLMGKNAEAVQQFQKALDSHPELPEPHVYLAQALWEMGEIDRALSHLKDAEQLAPKDPKIKSMAKSIREKKG